jgi:hypothetical protein
MRSLSDTLERLARLRSVKPAVRTGSIARTGDQAARHVDEAGGLSHPPLHGE